MALFVTACPHCHKNITLDDQWKGLEVNCPICNKALIVPAPAAPTVAAVNTAAPATAVSNTASPRTKLQIKRSEPTVSPAANSGAQFVFECPNCKTKAVLPMNMFHSYYCCNQCKQVSKAGVFALGRGRSKKYASGTENRLTRSTKADIISDLKTAGIMLAMILFFGFPVYLVCQYSGLLGGENGKIISLSKKQSSSSSSSSSSSDASEGEKAAGHYVPDSIAGKPGTNRALMLKERKEAIEKFEDDAISWQNKMNILMNLVERYPELKKDHELLDWKERIEEKL